MFFAVIISIFVWLFVVVSCLVYFPIALLIFLVTLPFDRQKKVLHAFSCFWGSSYVWINPLWAVRIEGRGHIERGKAYLITPNHQSLLDIILLYGLFRHYKWVAKDILFKVPFIGWNMGLNGYLSIKRDSPRSQIAMIKTAIETLKKGSSVMVFPEGTRTPDGEVHEFKAGTYKMAQRAGVPVIPIAIDGSWQAIPKRGFIMRKRQAIRVKILPPVSLDDYENIKAAAADIQNQVADTLAHWRQGQE